MMSAFAWKHGVTADEARSLVQMKLASDGIGQHVSWNGNRFEVSIGWGFVLKVVGEITDETIRMEQVSGAMARATIAKSRDELAALFPDGYELTAMQDTVANH